MIGRVTRPQTAEFSFCQLGCPWDEFMRMVCHCCGQDAKPRQSRQGKGKGKKHRPEAMVSSDSGAVMM